MSSDQPHPLVAALEAWEKRYQSERASLTLKETHELRVVMARLAEEIEREAIGPSTMPVTPPPSA